MRSRSIVRSPSGSCCTSALTSADGIESRSRACAISASRLRRSKPRERRRRAVRAEQQQLAIGEVAPVLARLEQLRVDRFDLGRAAQRLDVAIDEVAVAADRARPNRTRRRGDRGCRRFRGTVWKSRTEGERCGSSRRTLASNETRETRTPPQSAGDNGRPRSSSAACRRAKTEPLPPMLSAYA